MSKLIHVASATATNAASVSLPMLVTMLMNDGSLVTGSATGNAAAIALRGPLAAADTVALLLASSLFCSPPPVLVLVMLLFFVIFSSGDSTGTVTPLHSGRSPHGGCQCHAPVLQCRTHY